MENLTPLQFQEWINFFWSIGWKGLIVFSVFYYRDLVTKIIGTFIDVIASYIKK